MWLVFILVSVFFWALCNVLDSLLVRHYEKNPVVLMWSQSAFSILFLCLVTLFFPLRTVWIPWLFLGGCIAYFGDLLFFLALDRIDVSVTNIAWALLALFLTVVGFLFFEETWNAGQTVGSVLVLSGVVYLSVAHREFTCGAFMLLVALALLYLPVYSFQKAAFLQGVPVIPVAFWSLFGREVLSFSAPLFVPVFRRRINALRGRVDAWYFGICLLAVVFFIAGTVFGAQAYSMGSVSLVSVAGNAQPFFVLALAWILWRLLPRYASRELFTAQSVFVKVVSFLIVFVGMAYLATS